jgi:hypothetical protein
MKTFLAVTLVLGLLHHDRIDTVKLPAGTIAEQYIGEGTLALSPLFVVGDRVIYIDGIEHEPRAVSVATSLRYSSQRTLGDADVVMPSVNPGRLWLGSVWLGRRHHRGLRTLREVALDGRTTFTARHTTPGQRLVGVADDGLIFAQRDRLVVWDPHTERTSRTFGGRHLAGTHGALIATCHGRCFALRLDDRRSVRIARAPGRTHFLRVPGAFSPDGGLLAVPVAPRRFPRIALVDTARGTSTLVPGARLGRHAALAWAPGERRLLFAGVRGRIFTYVPGSRRPQQLDLPFDKPIAQLLVAR